MIHPIQTLQSLKQRTNLQALFIILLILYLILFCLPQLTLAVILMLLISGLHQLLKALLPAQCKASKNLR